MSSPDYTVKLDQVFQGPMDLLLHLVREQEVEIHEIEISRVLDGFLAHLQQMQAFDIELASEFVLMAATLMAIKSRSLLPREEVDLESELDPRDELIQRLIEYRRFKEASRGLHERFEERARLHGRGFHPKEEQQEPSFDLAELSRWDLLAAFSRLLRETMAHRALHIAPDERPLRYYVDQLVGWVKREREVSLRRLVASASPQGALDRRQVIGTFCALLELMKIGVVSARQAAPGDDIRIVLRAEAGEDIEDIVRLSGLDDELDPPAAPPSVPAPSEASAAAEEPEICAVREPDAHAGPSDSARDAPAVSGGS